MTTISVSDALDHWITPFITLPTMTLSLTRCKLISSMYCWAAGEGFTAVSEINILEDDEEFAPVLINDCINCSATSMLH